MVESIGLKPYTEDVKLLRPLAPWLNMKALRQIEQRVLELSQALDLRPTLEKAAEIGELLVEARSQVQHGQWAGWLARCGLRPRTAWDYIAVANAKVENRWPATRMTIKQFLDTVRRAKFAERRAERQAERQAAAGERGKLPSNVEFVQADCRKHLWPDHIDIIATDPPWTELDAYKWLAGFAAQRLRIGGLLLVQCATMHMPQVMNLMCAARLNYVWTMAIIYSETRTVRANGRFRATWSPILVFSRGDFTIPQSLSDGYTVRGGEKNLHDWQQPIEPWRYWLDRLARPGAVVADPFVGSGTIGCVCREYGLCFHGTELDKVAYRIARGRILSHEVQSPAPDDREGS